MKTLVLHRTLNQEDKEIQEKIMREYKKKFKMENLKGQWKVTQYQIKVGSRNQNKTMVKMTSR